MDEEGKGAMVANSADWAELTRECLTNILSRLTLEERWRGPMLVCGPWLQACKDPSLNSVFDLDPFFDSSAESAHWWSTEFQRKIDSMLRSVADCSDGALKEIRVRHCSDSALEFAVRRCPGLGVLSIKRSQSVTDAAMSALASSCPLLEELDISYCHEISHESLALVGSSCPDLTILKRNLLNWLDPSQHTGIVLYQYLSASPVDGDSVAAAIGKSMPNLVQLELQFSNLTAKGLAFISEGCQNLEYLDLTGCANLTSQEIVNACTKLKNLKMVKKPNFFIPRWAEPTIGRSPNQRHTKWRIEAAANILRKYATPPFPDPIPDWQNDVIHAYCILTMRDPYDQGQS